MPLTEAKSKYASLVKEQMDAWIGATYKQKADQLRTMVKTLLINRVRENPANPDASSDETPSREMTDSDRSEEKVKVYAKIKESAENSKGIARFGVRNLCKARAQNYVSSAWLHLWV